MSKIKIHLLSLLLGLDFYGCIKIINYIRKLVMYIYIYLEAMGISYLSFLRLSINDIMTFCHNSVLLFIFRQNLLL